ncbi:TIGR03086 family metal-binding protein [Kutzneria kofuensis]|uniref:Uncharacterized protein (TIGR03086 family) n=1 Tax=Kutzneria kofuensis TaxID=103725 RepID=A0A7W9KQV2_9PSEU|nr:TIGR03086 family metal-binding protein [Kutzneria kofuensis]MBB5896967.1 uncharacterized protein (TIGR03086 family) [Kutzneria kofuensis]
MNVMELYGRAQDGFDAVLAGVGPDQWETPSTCPDWSVRDVAGHVIWAQRQLRAWATGEEYADHAGAPGSPRPAVLAEGDPLKLWREAREEATATLTGEALAKTVALPGVGEIPLVAVVTLLLTDTATHTWDIAHALGEKVVLDPAVVSAAFEWSRANVIRRPGFFGPELAPPDDADEQTRLLAFLGRTVTA